MDKLQILKKPCIICGEGRYTEKCHIINRAFDGTFKQFGCYEINLFSLCPTHHKLFDKGLLNKEELGKIECLLKEKLSIIVKTYKNHIEEYKLLNPKIIQGLENPAYWLQIYIKSEEESLPLAKQMVDKKIRNVWPGN